MDLERTQAAMTEHELASIGIADADLADDPEDDGLRFVLGISGWLCIGALFWVLVIGLVI